MIAVNCERDFAFLDPSLYLTIASYDKTFPPMIIKLSFVVTKRRKMIDR